MAEEGCLVDVTTRGSLCFFPGVARPQSLSGSMVKIVFESKNHVRRSVCALMCVSPFSRSPLDEEGVHHSFDQLIAEQSQNGGQGDAFELQQVQRELEDESRGGQIITWLFRNLDFF